MAFTSAPPNAPILANMPEYSVSDLSQAVKGTVEKRFEHIRVRGEISRPAFPTSGHIYLRLKDERAALDGVIWRPIAQKLKIQLEEGLEVVCVGRLTTYPAASRYQMVIEAIEPAGAGALLKILEERRLKLAAEGLFAESDKKPIPFLPKIIGLITSPTGAVIRDILHRLDARFPRHVLVWPAQMQGIKAAPTIVKALIGFNTLIPKDQRPDILIVARGGGSLEDLWAFNDETIIRAVYASDIPVIAAIGHETDTTLIDLVADLRAPTPSAAAEMVVPVRSALRAQLLENERRLVTVGARLIASQYERLVNLSRGLGDPIRLLEEARQRLDIWGERLDQAIRNRHRDGVQRLAGLHLITPKQKLTAARQATQSWTERLAQAIQRILVQKTQALTRRPLTPAPFAARMALSQAALKRVTDLLESYSYRRILDRGFVLVTTGPPEQPLTSAAMTQPGQKLHLHFKDDKLVAYLPLLEEKGEEKKWLKPSIHNRQPSRKIQEDLF